MAKHKSGELRCPATALIDFVMVDCSKCNYRGLCLNCVCVHYTHLLIICTNENQIHSLLYKSSAPKSFIDISCVVKVFVIFIVHCKKRESSVLLYIVRHVLTLEDNK